MPDTAMHDPLRAARENIQANLVRAGKYRGGATRDWQLFFFFRIMPEDDVLRTIDHAKDAMAAGADAAARLALFLDLEQPGLANANRIGAGRSPSAPSTEAAAEESAPGAATGAAAAGAPATGAAAAAAPAAAAPAPNAVAQPQASGSEAPAPPTAGAPAASEAAQALASDVSSASGGPAGGRHASRPNPAPSFRSWLKMLVSADKTGLFREANFAATLLFPDGVQPSDKVDAAEFHRSLLELRVRLSADDGIVVDPVALKRFAEDYLKMLADPAVYQSVVAQFGATPEAAGERALQGSLCSVALYELLRQAAPAFATQPGADAVHGAVRGEEHAQRSSQDGEALYDPLPITIAFTYAGLDELKLDEVTLSSFPEPFKQGMAARAVRLGDTGSSAPENWHSEFGLPSIHGYFTGGFPAGTPHGRIKESVWRSLRDDIGAFNDADTEHGRFLRRVIGLMFRQFGLEIVRIELGQDPYKVGEDGYAERLDYRYEHFGFRDGLSQPFADLGIGDAPPGGGTPDAGGTWSPVAPGEIYLDLPDSDGAIQKSPINGPLRCGGTFIVFRKLEQDVAGFRRFLHHQRPGNPDDQKRLAAQFVGRWPDGTPLVLSPDAAEGPPPPGAPAANDFRYFADDPLGQKCPLGAHIRRANPRDTGGRGEVKRHRILRRGISYGGPMLAADSRGDGQPRGLFFIAINSRIDLQFEVIQADWINGGELLGQAGLGACPLVGAHDGGVQDSFLEAGAAVPVTGLPSFVTTRGGDYFFAPGVDALGKIADGEVFAADDDDVPFNGAAMGAAVTPGLFDRDRLQRYARRILIPGGPGIVRVPLPPESPSRPGSLRESLVFVGQHADVVRVLSDLPVDSNGQDVPASANPPDDARPQFSVLQYQITGQRITRGADFLVGTETSGSTRELRGKMMRMLSDAWQSLATTSIATSIAQRLDAAIARTGPSGRIDLVHDLAVPAAYGVVADLLGVVGPKDLTELAAALPFGTQHVASLPPDWLAAAKGADPADPGMTSMQIWSVLVLADMLGNLQSDHAAWPFSRQAGSEMLTRIDELLALADSRFEVPRPSAEAERPPVAGQPRAVAASSEPKTMVDAFARRARSEGSWDSPARQNYLRLAAVILMELAGDMLAAVPSTFARIMEFVLANRIDLTALQSVLDAPAPPGARLSGAEQLILEAERLNPILPVLLRRCEVETTLPSGGVVHPGEWVAALVEAANLDPSVYNVGGDLRKPTSQIFSLAPFLPGPTRNWTDYLAFGAPPGNHVCWGRDPFALPVLVECLKAAARLPNLRMLAGAAGQTQSLVGVPIGLPARFTPATRARARSQRAMPSVHAASAGAPPAEQQTQSAGPVTPGP